jgi:RNA-binding protein
VAIELSSRQRRKLKALAHPLQPTVHVGRAGITDAVVASVDRALLDHELIKVQMREPEDKKAMARHLAEATSAALCGLLGHTVILYRPHPETPTIALD